MLTEEIKQIIGMAVQKGFNDKTSAEIAMLYKESGDKENFYGLLNSLTADEFFNQVIAFERRETLKRELSKKFDSGTEVFTLSARAETELGGGYTYTIGMANFTEGEYELIACSENQVLYTTFSEIIDRFADTEFPSDVFTSEKLKVGENHARFKLIKLDESEAVVGKLFHISLPDKVKRAKRVLQLLLPDDNNRLPGEEGYKDAASQNITDYLAEEALLINTEKKH